jgi:hypothetical protein
MLFFVKKLLFMIKKFLTTLCLGASIVAQAQNEPLTLPEQTEVWQPEPTIVVPGTVTTAPSDAYVLFDGKNTDAWQQADGKPIQWKVEDGVLTVVKGAGDILSKQSFGDCQLHLEWRSPVESDDLKGQQKGNSGVFFQNRYEVQILNSYKNRTYSNGQAGAIYKQNPPLANACRPVGEWNTYDIIYKAPRWRANGSRETPGYFTVIHNGVVIQNHTEIQGTTEYIGAPQNKSHGNAPFKLQDHGNLVSYRNIWVRPL